MHIQRKHILRYPNKNFPGTWIICLLIGIMTFIFAMGFLSLKEYWWSIIVASVFLVTTTNYFLQAYAWFRDREEVKIQYKIDAEKEVANNKQLTADIKSLFTRKN